ncbi:hypothetical protein [Paractinoplanes rishiriensis]|uniref:Uncharacterized protein n=1 Tax=Paractinoplanes rishiriensis TaxID=1050105 RepID=A0A919K2B3_9ACTN|nr:hypothetical protein [Actinoplanes rishiriensis]GIE95321.1 hypothetical protein Ari01nite_27860 [Actinoplanes rishiriensis]
MRRVRINTVGYGLGVLTLVGALAVVLPITVHAEEAPKSPSTAHIQPDRVVTLPTGERVFLTAAGDGRQVRGVEPPAGARTGADPVRVRTMSVADHHYVVPESALPFVGRQLDLSLFDVRNPAAAIQVEWEPGVTPRTIPGLDLKPAAGDKSTGRVGDPAAFGAAMAGAATQARTSAARSTTSSRQVAVPATGPLAGVRSVRAATASAAAEPTANPQFPLANLTVKGLDALGVAAFSGGVSITNAEDVQRFSSMQSFVNGEVSFSVPEGHYSLEVSITTYDAETKYVGDALLFFPEIEIVGPQMELVADARKATTAVPVPTTPNPSGLEQMQATFSRMSAAGFDSTTAFMMVGGSPSLKVTPTDPVSIGAVRWYTYFRLNAPSGAADPYLYDLVFPADGSVPDNFAEQVPAGSLATLDTTYAGEAGAAPISTYRTSFQDWEQFPIRFASTANAPLRRTEYLSAAPDMGWVGTAVAKPDEFNGAAQSPMVVYQAGAKLADRFLAAPMVPGVDRGTVRTQSCPACRQDDQLMLNLQPFTDAGGHGVRMTTSATATIQNQMRVYADGQLVGQATDPAGSIVIPGGSEQMKLELDSSVTAPWVTTSAKVHTAWTWRTATPTAPLPPGGRTCLEADAPCSYLPLLFAAYDLGVDTTNAVPAGVAVPLTVTVRPQEFAPAPAADKITLEVSGDDGATWSPVTTTAAGGGKFTGSVTPAAGSEFLSFRLHASEATGGTLDQTVTRALRVTG